MRLPEEWIKRADFLFKQAKENMREEAYWFVCFEVHQAVELYLKAFSLALVGIHPYTHDLVELLEFLREAGENPPQELYPLADALTPHYTISRYPGRSPIKYSREVAERCLKYGEEILSWVKEATEG